MKGERIDVHITLSSIVNAALLVILGVLLWFLRDIVLIVLTAIVIASAMEPAVRFWNRFGVNRILSVILMYLIAAAVFGSVLFFFLPPVLDDAASLLKGLPQALSSINLADTTHGLLPWGDVGSLISSADVLQQLSSTLAESTGGVFTTLSAFFGGVTSFVLIVVFSFYFSVQETGIDDFLRVITPAAHQAYVLNLWKRSQMKIGKWMQGQLVLAVIVGVLLYLGLLILGIQHALLLAVLAAIFELIPVFGQFLAAIPAIAVSFVSDGFGSALLVLGLYVIVQQFEAHLIYPVVVKRVVGVPPLLVILALIVGYKLAGFLGVLLSVPIAGAIQELVSDIDRQKTRALSKAGLTPEGEPK